MTHPALPLRLLAWGALGVSLHIGLARFGYGVVLPSLRVELGLGYTAGGVLNAVHLGGYLAVNGVPAHRGLAITTTFATRSRRTAWPGNGTAWCA